MHLRLRFIALLAGLYLVLAARPAHANFVIAIGVKYAPVNYTTPVSTTGANMTTPLAGWNTTALNNYFGLFFLEGQLGVQLGLDLGYSSRHDDAGAMVGNQDLSYTQFGFSIGGKYYITKPRAGKVAPYVYLDFYKYFASISTSSTVPKGYESFLASLSSPLGIDAAVGAEYFFTPGFSIGAEVLGLKYAFTEGSYTPGPGGLASLTISETNHYVTFYTGLSLNYRFDIVAQVRVREPEETSDEDEAPRPRRKKKEAPQPPPEAPSSEPPPPAAESVD
jgi:hypothetical protein